LGFDPLAKASGNSYPLFDLTLLNDLTANGVADRYVTKRDHQRQFKCAGRDDRDHSIGLFVVRYTKQPQNDTKEHEMATSGYSGTPLAKKLGIKEGMTVAVVDAPENYAELVAPLPAGVRVVSGTAEDMVAAYTPFRDAPAATPPAPGSDPADILHLFTNTRDGLFRGLADAKHRIKQNGAIWVSWYKKAAKLPTEITEDTIREAALPLGLVDVKVCAVDEKWSGLKLVIRKENRI